MTRAVVAIALAVAAVVGCGGDDDGDGASRPAPTTRAPVTTTAVTSVPATAAPRAALATIRLRAARVASGERPVAFAVRPGDGTVLVAEQSGRVRPLLLGASGGGRLGPAVIDVSDDLSSGNEQGLLGLAVSPDGSKLYTNHTDARGDTRITEWSATGSGRRELLTVDQPFANHNGGQLVARPDGTLWIALGDGGASGDPRDNAQSLDTLLGKILRIDPTRRAAGRAYAIPRDNPFVARSDARPEIWAYGLRNPWRFTFDRGTGDLWIGDVGQGRFEEIDHEPAGSRGGANYGWDRREGAHRFEGEAPPGVVDPVFEYATHDGGTCAVVGGFVYRGRAIPGLAGAYLYGDACTGTISALRVSNGRVTDAADLPRLRVPGLSSFGEDTGGELWVLALDGAISRLEAAP